MTHRFSSPRPLSPSPLLVLAAAVSVLLTFGLLAAPAHADACTTTNECGSSPSVSCSASSSSLIGADPLEWNGQRTYGEEEASCTAQYTCPSPPYSNPYDLVCFSASGQCSVDESSDSITCDSTTVTCAECEALAPRLMLCFF